MECLVNIAMSIDGYIAGPNGELDWLNRANSNLPEGEDCGFAEFFNSIDCLVMGKNTYEKVLSFGQWPYKEKPVVVLSHSEIEIPTHLQNVTWLNEKPSQIYNTLSKKGYRKLYIDGGNTFQQFLSTGLINKITITFIPVILGQGISLFGSVEKELELRHISTKQFDFGFVQSTYEVKHPYNK